MLMNGFADLQEVLLLERPMYAHMDDKGIKEKELLTEHTALCEKYFRRLMEKKKMRNSLLNLEKELLAGYPEEVSVWFRQALYGIITFHDTGKSNPMFQSVRMKNTIFNGQYLNSVDSYHHSMLSAAIYLDYFLAGLESLLKDIAIKKKQWVWLYELLILNAFLISRHHSTLDNYQEFLKQMKDGGAISTIWEDMDAGGYRALYKGRFCILKSSSVLDRIQRTAHTVSEKQKFAAYIHARLIFSLLTACDYYATNEYANGTETTYFGSVDEIREMGKHYEKSLLVQSIRRFGMEECADDGENINFLRNSMFLEAEENLLKGKDGTLFFLEAPTGSGKSNMALNISFKLLEEDMDKIVYVYPFNNLVEQNKASLQDVFGGTSEYEKIAVLNSVTPIPVEKKSEKDDEYPAYYAKALLDRQFLNYPFILTTHVSLFQTMFGIEREAVFGFHQLVGSVLVLDEIQSYKNTIWTELIRFLQHYGEFLNCKILIMSATLPDFELLTEQKADIVRLIQNRERYFSDARFRNRVTTSYELIRPDFSLDELYEHVKSKIPSKKKIMVEFIKKDMTYEFYDMFCQDEEIGIPVERMTGDDNSIDREQILRKVKDEELCRNGFLLIATQVVEAGLDIDMDIGYKDISFLDGEEQFLGRINRNYKREGIVYFFNLCDAARIYDNDYRTSKTVTLENPEMRKVLDNKDFALYYKPVLEMLKSLRNDSCDKEGYGHFIEEEIGKLDFKKVEERMKLIGENAWDMSVFLARTITDSKGDVLEGSRIWEDYKAILTAPPKDYARFRIELSEIKSKLNYFIYKIRKNSNITYNDRIGELYYIENGEEYFENGKLDKNKLMQRGALFLEL